MHHERWRTSARLAVREAARGVRSQPRIQTTWGSATRRSAVVVAFIIVGVVIDDLALVVGGAFGALQVGYADVGLPLMRLVRYLLLNTLAVGVAVLVSATIGGSWLTIPWLVALALVAGLLARGSAAGVTATFNALVLGIVFSGVAMPVGGAFTVTLWVVAGSAAQSVVWLLWWRWDRRSHVDLALANDLESIRRMTLRKQEFGMEVAESAGVETALQNVLQMARLPKDSTDEAIVVASWIALVRRAAITWIEVADPSLAERESLANSLKSAEQLVRGHRKAAWVPLGVVGEQACVTDLHAALDGLRTAVDHWRALPAPRGSNSSKREQPDSSVPLPWRHAIRIAAAVGLAQAISLPLAADHSFWIPLTVAFIVKPDWAYTVIRTILRLGGTIGAVLLFGYTAGWLIDHRVGYVMVAFVLVLVTLRWTSGNYAVAAFAVTGFILLIDSTLDRGPDLPLERLLFTVGGSIIGLVAALLVPTWVSKDVPATVRGLVEGLSQGVGAILSTSGRPTPDATYAAGLRIRDSLERLRVVAVGTALEPRGRSFSTAALLDVLDRGQIVLVRLWALGTYELMSARTGGDPPVSPAALERVTASLHAAGRAVHGSDVVPDTEAAIRSPLPAGMAHAADVGFSGKTTHPTPDEARRVALLAAEFERDVVRLEDAVRQLAASAVGQGSAQLGSSRP